MFASFFVFALVAQAQAACNVTVTVTCSDCVLGQKWKAALYFFTEDGVRAQTAIVPTMESGGTISSGSMEGRRRFLDINGAEIDTITCEDGVDSVKGVEITRDMLGVHALQPDPQTVPMGMDTEDDDEEEFEEEEEESNPEPSPRVPVAAMSLLDPLPEPEHEPEDGGEGMGSSLPRVVGWAAPGGDPVWTGNAGDYPSAPATKRQGKFAEPGVTQCPADKLPSVLGTADHISGGRPAQDALDDARASDLAPADWNGAYAIALRTAILGDQAAAVWCINPGDLNPTSPEGRAMLAAAELPPPAPLGVTPEDLQKALEAQAKKLREELTPPEEGPLPETVASTLTPHKFVLRKGLFTQVQYAIVDTKDGQANYLHVIGGGFVTFNITPEGKWLGLEPYLGVGSDGQSDHCDATGDSASCSGWYLSTTVGVRLPVTVNPKKDKVQLILYPDFGIVSDDVTVGFTSWADLVSVKAGVELWLPGYAPVAVSLAVGGTRLSFLNDNSQHQNGYAVPVELAVKAAFK